MAHAQPADLPVVEQLVEMNRKALRDYETANWNAARKTLLEALSAGKKARLDTHGILARTYLHLGMVFAAGFRDHEKAVSNFARALEIDPAIRVRRAMETPDITAAFAAAQKEVEAATPAPAATSAPATTPAPAAPAAPAASSDRPRVDEAPAAKPAAPLDCPSSGEAPAHKPIDIRCSVAAGLGVASVHLYYRGPDQKKFASIEMDKAPQGKGKGGWYEIAIPEYVGGDGGAVQYYVEGRDESGKRVVLNGSNGSPNIMLVGQLGAGAGAGPSGEKAETREAPPAEASEPAEENPLDERTMHHGIARHGGDPGYGNRRFWVGLGAGTGFGYAKGDGLEASGPVLQSHYEPGLGWAGLGHLIPEVGYHIRPDMAVSIQARVQWIPQPARYGKIYATGAEALLARLLFFGKPQRLRPFWGAMAGGGGFRFTLHPDADAPDVKDTVRGGPVLLGGGGGVSYQLTKVVSLVAEINALLGMPAFSAVADLNLACQINIY